MGPKKVDNRPSRRSGRSNQTKSTNIPASTPQQRVPQNAPSGTKVPRPAVWEPVSLRDETEWTVDDPEYFDEVSEQLASLFDRRPKGWKTQKETGGSAARKVLNGPKAVPGGAKAALKKPTLEDAARIHAYYGRLKVYKQSLDGNGWSSRAGFDDAWHAERLLGAGTFGRVGLWVQRDENDHVVDEMAIKEEDYDKNSIWTGGLSEEAVFNELMNRGDVENIQRLRGFKSFKTPLDNPVLRYKGEGGDRRWRYYLEYAPHGSLQRLIARYRAWNRYLPESFLWHIFDGLAQVLVTFDETKPNPKEHRRGMLRAADRLVHFDIKPDNIFLGYEQPFDSENNNYGGHQSNVYPMVKIGDFGVAAMTSEKDRDQKEGRFWGVGTTYYMSPEQMHYGAGFSVPPNGKRLPLQDEQGHFIAIETRQSDGNPAGIFFTQPVNVWGVGKVMYDLATLSHCYDYAGISTQNYEEYEKWNNNAIEDFQRNPFVAANRAKAQDDASPSPYTNDLMNLIEQCLKPAAQNRIKAQEVKAVTEEVLARYGSDDGLEMNEKVYFVGNEINDMQIGPEDFPFHEGPMENTLRWTSWTDIDQLMDYSVGADEPELQPPRWPKEIKAYKEDWKKARAMPYNKYWHKNCHIVNGKVVFHSNPMTAAGSRPPGDQEDEQDQSDNDALEADDSSANAEPAKASKSKAPPKNAAGKKPATGKGGLKKGAKSEAKSTNAPKGGGVKKTIARKPVPIKPAARKGAATKTAAQAISTTTGDASQARTSPPKRAGLPRAAKAGIVDGKYKV